LGESLFFVLRDSILNPILDSLFSIFYFVMHVVKDWKVYRQSFGQTLTEMEYSTTSFPGSHTLSSTTDLQGDVKDPKNASVSNFYYSNLSQN